MSYVLFPSTLKPTGLFSTHEDIFGKGGFVSLTGEANNLAQESDIQDFLNTNIIEQRRKLGMLVYISSIKRYYTCSSVTGEAGISGDWDRQYFSGRYFHGPSAPTEQDIQIGERWFDTIAGTEYTYIPIQEGSDQYAWVDIDHIGSGGGGSMIYFYGDNAPTEAIGATIGSKWFNTELGAELTLLPNEPDNGGETGTVWVMVNSLASGASGDFVLKTGDTMSGTLTADRAFRTSSDINFSSNEFVTKNYVDGLSPSGDFVLKTGDEMSGTLTGTDASFDKSVVVSNSGSYENQPFLTIAKIGGINEGYAGFYPGTTAFMDLPRLVLNNFSNNSWGWPKAIDFMARPTAGDQNAVIGWRIGDTYTTSGKSFLTFWGAPTRTSFQGPVGISAGLSGQGLEKLGYFQVGVGRNDNGLYTEKSFRTSLDPVFRDDEFITKSHGDENYLLGDLSGYSTKTSDKNLITNGNFLVWQRGRQFRYLSDTRLRNQTKKQIGLNYFNVEHNSNWFTPKTHISGRFKSGNYNYGSMFSAAADRWVFGWQNTEDGNPSAPVTGSGFYVYRGFINPEDSQIVKNSKYFCRVSTSPPPSYSENRIEPIYTSPTNIGSIQNSVNPTSPNGLTYGAIVNHLVGDDRPSELSGQTADIRRVTDTQYVSSYFDPYNTCIPITGDTDVPGTRAKLRNDYWAGFSQTISYEDFRSMDFGTENAKDLTLRFYARGNVPGEYYVTFTNAGARTLGVSQYPDRGRLYTKGFTIDEPNQWKLYQITCEGDKVNEPSSGLTGCWNYPDKKGNWPGLQVNWCVGSATGFQAENSAWKSIPPNSSYTDHTLAIRTDGSLWAWGGNSAGQLGLGDSGSETNRNTPVQVGGDTDWESVHNGIQFSLALKTDGSLWTWGLNTNGQLGSGTIGGQSSTPSEVDGDGVTWASASCGGFHTLAIKKDGSLWAWGANEFGQLGLGISSLSIPTPTRVSPIEVTWNSVSCGYSHTLAIKSDGTLWAWGYNIAGQLGLGDGGAEAHRYSPVQVGEDTDWESVSCGYLHTLAIKTDGSLWAWGANSDGQLGLGDSISSELTPVRVSPIGVTWDSVSCGYLHTLAIKSDGTLWAWGSNVGGQLGLGDTTQRTSPVQVGQQIWNKVCASNSASFALGVGQNSYLYSWGRNVFGMLGQGDIIDRYDPTLLTLLTLVNNPVGSWRYADGIGNVWGASGQANLLSATGNYLDIAEVSLVDTNYTKEIYFPRSDSEIMSECRKYFFGSRIYQSETNAPTYFADGTFVGTNLAYYGSTNEVQVPHIPDTIRWPHNGGLYSELFSVNNAVNDSGTFRSSNLAETAFIRVFNCVASSKATGVFPADKSTSGEEQKTDFNINTGTVQYDGSNYTTESVVQAIVTHTGSYFGTPALREGYGWDAATADMISYFKYPYGCRGFSTPRIISSIIDWRTGFSKLNSFAVSYSNVATNSDIAVSGQIWLDAEFAYGD